MTVPEKEISYILIHRNIFGEGHKVTPTGRWQIKKEISNGGIESSILLIEVFYEEIIQISRGFFKPSEEVKSVKKVWFPDSELYLIVTHTYPIQTCGEKKNEH